MAPVMVLVGVLGSPPADADQHRLVITRIVESPFTDLGVRILTEAYGRLGVPIQFELMPGARAIKSTDMGLSDGELFRVDGMTKQYPNLIRVPVPIARTDFVVFTNRKPFIVNGYSSLASYRIAFRRGMKILETGTAEMDRFMVGDPEQAFRMLERDRVDIVIENRLTGIQIIRTMRLSGIAILEPPLHSDPLYHYVNKRHAALVPKLTAILQQMRDQGEIKRMEADAVRALSN